MQVSHGAIVLLPHDIGISMTDPLLAPKLPLDMSAYGDARKVKVDLGLSRNGNAHSVAKQLVKRSVQIVRKEYYQDYDDNISQSIHVVANVMSSP